ncbi:transcriptional regulator [Streptomyces sp. NRRL F-4489]|uniref:TetR/AcrR family transcriptional regulator n=1 Tax=Streptomyces sp. NRRL F-4489 TaxID=1609095 RepID=UPI0007496FA0|nr:TetR/AcrR family transcriptional regulator C-terminal domain-containing protein [Streptomyces sp. NRRL F-4489]KUL38746.1 transcriptional regulator [Streptomyces sp. NRRL F-4489]
MGRPRKALLDRARIGATALQLVDEKGDFSVPEVARRLGVQTASVYHHVDGRAGVVELLRERVTDAIDPAALDAGAWDAALAAWARSYRAAFAAHPRAIPMLMTSPVRAPRVLAQYDRVAGLLLDAGFPPDAVMPVITGLDNLVLGSALDMSAPEPMWEVSGDAEAPRLAAAQAATGPDRADAAFELTLAGYLAHLRALLERAGRDAAG